jgi:hypothetical protein
MSWTGCLYSRECPRGCYPWLGRRTCSTPASIALESLFQGLQSELPVSEESHRRKRPRALAGLGFRVICYGLSPEESRPFASISHNLCPPVEEGSVDPLVQVFARPCKYVPRFYYVFSHDLAAHGVADGQAMVERESLSHG